MPSANFTGYDDRVRRSGKHDTVDAFWMSSQKLLSDDATKGKAQQINCFELKLVQQLNHVPHDGRDGVLRRGVKPQ